MRKLGVLLVVSILLFVFGTGTFVYELSQISPNQIDVSQETQTMTTTMPNACKLYTKTYLSSIGDVHVVVDEMVEDDKLQDDALVITYPKMLHVVQDEDQLDIQMDDYEMSKDFQTIFNTFRTKSYDEYFAKNNEIHVSIRYGKALKDKITLVDDYY
ncbi:hypothetical protein [Holdemanella biformis]|uniref:hypothetical protein n=1 Tax=Holdemanella biformis TaxID=1735 RepID=UPI001D134640|nr:hypothetical protein [Holdemanella biformis]MBD9054274.1 hypothetical protein [Holdemanella biformis]MCC3355060.1 hypothetical protein [Holdemanella biformis]